MIFKLLFIKMKSGIFVEMIDYRTLSLRAVQNSAQFSFPFG